MEKLHLKLGEVMEEAASAAALTRRSLNASREKEAASEAFFRRVCQRDNTGRQPNDKDARQKFYWAEAEIFRTNFEKPDGGNYICATCNCYFFLKKK